MAAVNVIQQKMEITTKIQGQEIVNSRLYIKTQKLKNNKNKSLKILKKIKLKIIKVL